MASLLNLKPITEVRDGIIVEAGRARARKAMAITVSGVQRIANRPVRLVIHANCGPEADQLLAQAQQALHVTESHITENGDWRGYQFGAGVHWGSWQFQTSKTDFRRKHPALALNPMLFNGRRLSYCGLLHRDLIVIK